MRSSLYLVIRTLGRQFLRTRGIANKTHCFLRHVIGLTLFALKLWMIDLRPSTHCWKKEQKNPSEQSSAAGTVFVLDSPPPLCNQTTNSPVIPFYHTAIYILHGCILFFNIQLSFFLWHLQGMKERLDCLKEMPPTGWLAKLSTCGLFKYKPYDFSCSALSKQSVQYMLIHLPPPCYMAMWGGPSLQRLIRSVGAAYIAYLSAFPSTALKSKKLSCLLRGQPEQAGMCSHNFCIRTRASTVAHTITPWVYKEKWRQMEDVREELRVCKSAFY